MVNIEFLTIKEIAEKFNLKEKYVSGKIWSNSNLPWYKDEEGNLYVPPKTADILFNLTPKKILDEKLEDINYRISLLQQEAEKAREEYKDKMIDEKYPLKDLLSTREYTVVKNMKIKTTKEFVEMFTLYSYDLKNYRGLGKKTKEDLIIKAKEIKELLKGE